MTGKDYQPEEDFSTYNYVDSDDDAGAAGPLPWADDNGAPLTAEDIARATDAMNFALVAFNVPDRFRPYIDALIGASGGSMDWFEASDIEIAQRARNVTALGLKEKSLEKWTQRFREDFAEWAQAYKTALVEAMPGGKREGVNYKSRYRIRAIFQIAIEVDRRARAFPFFDKQPKRAMRKASAAVYLEHRAKLDNPPKRQRFKPGRRTCDTYVKIINTALENLSGRALIEHRDLPTLLMPILLNIQGKCELLNNSLAHFPNTVQVQQAQADSAGVWGDNLSPQNSGVKDAENGYVHTGFKKEYGQDFSPAPPPIVGQTVEEFISETWPDSLPDSEPGPTAKMAELISRTGHIVPASFSEASALIAELIAAGAFSTFLSLEELRQYDSAGGRGPGKEKRWCCPFDGKTITDEHRDLTVDIHTGEYFCHCCGAAGVLREYQGACGSARVFTHSAPQKPEQKSDKWREWWKRAAPIAGTPGAAYLAGRGVPIEAATAANVRYGVWWKRGQGGPEKFNAVQFPVLDADGQLVAVIARAIHGDTKRTGGDLKLGVFRATLDATDSSRIAITESPIDALILAAVGLDAVATGGTHWPEWLPAALQNIDVALAQDADIAGDECAAGLASLLPTSWRLRPVNLKDWAELAEMAGLDSVAECVMDAQERAPEVEQ